MKIGVSEQALSKWETGACLPDVHHLKLLAHILNVSADCLLDTENKNGEKIVETHGFKMAENGAQELEVFDTSEH